MNLINVQGFIYADDQLIGAPGADFLVAKRKGITKTVEIVIDATQHAGSEDIVLFGADYRALAVNGTTYASADAAVTGINALLTATRALPELVDASALPTSATSLASGDLYVASGTVKVKA